MHTYLAFLRGVNVGGKSLIKMSDLKTILAQQGFSNVRTYIQSGNIIFDSSPTDEKTLAAEIRSAISSAFQLDVPVAVFSKSDWRRVIESSPGWWGEDKTWKHNILILLEKVNMDMVAAEIGELKLEIEKLSAGERVLYQSVSWKYFGRAKSAKIASLPIYQKMTIRNINTATKLLTILDQ
jgi:uncharacterized protein (DUF1697 family)